MSPAWLRTALRRLRLERASAAGLALLVVVTAGLAAAAPRALDRLADDAVRAEIRVVPSATRGLQFSREWQPLGPAEDPLRRVGAAASELQQALAGPIGDVVGEPLVVIDSARWRVDVALPDPTFLRFRVQPGLPDRVRIIDGRAPGADVVDRPDPASTPEAPLPDLAVYEAAVSTITASTLEATVGDEVPISLDSRDPLVGPGRAQSAVARIVGIFEILDPADPWWYGDASFERPNVRALGPDVRLFDATAWLAEPALRPFLLRTGAVHLDVRTLWRFPVRPGSLEAEDRAPLIEALRRLEAAYPATVRPGEGTALRSGLRPALEASRARWAAAEAVLAVVAVGPAAVATGALGLATILAARRRRAALALARGRGASGAQVVAAIVAEGLLVAGPAGVLGVAAAIVLTPADPLAPSLVAGGATVVLAVGVLVAATLPGTARPGFGPGRHEGAPRPLRIRRLLFETAVVAGSVAGAWLLRERGIRGGSTAADLATVDPAIAVVPALLGLATGIVLARVLAPVMRLLARASREGRGLVLPLGLRRASGGPATAPLLAVLLGATAVGAFSALTALGLDRGADVAAWTRVGAPYRLTSITGSLGATFDPAAMPAVSRAALAARTIVGVGPLGLQAEVLSLDVRSYDEITVGTPAGGPDLPLPIDFFGDPGAGPIPAVVSASLAERPDGLAAGTTTRISVEGYSFEVRAVEVREAWPALSDAAYWIVLDREQVRARFPAIGLQPSVAFLAAPDDPAADAALRAWVATDRPGTYLDGRAALAAELKALPSVRAIGSGLVLATIVGAAYALLGVASALALAGSARAVETAHLRSLGLDHRAQAGLVALEHGPVIVAALIAGAGLGVGLHVLLRGSLGLASLTGAALDLPLSLDAAHLAVAGSIGVAVLALGLGLGVIMERAVAPATALRRGFE